MSEKRKISVTGLILAFFVCSGYASSGDETAADAGTGQPTTVAADGPPPRDTLVCRRYRTVGSHMPVRVCRTIAEMEADRAAVQDSMGMLGTMGGSEPKPKTSH